MLKRPAARGAHSCVSEHCYSETPSNKNQAIHPHITFGTSPSRAPCGKLVTWQLRTTSHFPSREGKGPLLHGQADTNCLSLVSQSFPTRGGRRMFGATSRCMQLFMLRPVYSSLSRRTPGYGLVEERRSIKTCSRPTLFPWLEPDLLRFPGLLHYPVLRG